MSLLISFRGPRRRQILLPAKGGRSSGDAGPMSLTSPGELRITRQARWIVTLELLETSLKLSLSSVGVKETSRTSESDAKSIFDANLSSQLAVGAPKITCHLAFGTPQLLIPERLHFFTQDQQQVRRMEEKKRN